MSDDGWIALKEPLRFPSPVVRFHKVWKDGEVVDTLAVLKDGRSVSLTKMLGDTDEDA